MRQSATVTVELNTEWRGEFTAEPIEVAWASEAIYFIRALDSRGVPGGVNARVQISPDGSTGAMKARLYRCRRRPELLLRG